MSSAQSLANQLAWCITTKDHLNNLITETIYVTKQYGDMVELLRDSNYLDEPLSEIVKMYEEFGTTCQDLVNHIKHDHLDYIERQRKSVNNALQAYLP